MPMSRAPGFRLDGRDIRTPVRFNQGFSLLDVRRAVGRNGGRFMDRQIEITLIQPICRSRRFGVCWFRGRHKDLLYLRLFGPVRCGSGSTTF